jgi:hypothetical protein
MIVKILQCNKTGGSLHYRVTKLSKLPDGARFYKVICTKNHVVNVPYIKITSKANNIIQCSMLYDEARPYSYLKGSTKVTVLSKE